ncbi:short-chain dehydrogenase/reductase SDR [Candidatus Phaeomarinobacter ectocarpi]|uniref:Short-chain dehydrogenase/reductase SDR n=1 Tax=Candidatus Phaeomarinibacter ectocarpi TaxID=1458461 RepID=X5MMT4_9HYPH|nr:SDR family oxidoreductase [Candidatus Phaeomarinobacter ectocarpi]CDO60680.1 short-chain dehydrogenase/reductase SDR [Candidatus Phaeomarinobacter ectocarpi]
MDLGLTGTVALVSGAHRGTGSIIASMLAAEGARVAVHGPAQGDSDTVVHQIQNAGHEALSVWGDLTTDEGAHQAMAGTIENAAAPSILINNWGGVAPGRWADTKAETWHADYERNVLSMVRLSALASEHMKAEHFGRIVNLGTLGTVQPAARTPHYYAAKSALAAASASLARELGPHGITVNLVSPGLIRTDEVEAHFRTRAQRKGWGSDWPEIEKRAMEEMGGGNPSGRMSTREEVAAGVLFLASKPASHISGVNLRVDGGAGGLSL